VPIFTKVALYARVGLLHLLQKKPPVASGVSSTPVEPSSFTSVGSTMFVHLQARGAATLNKCKEHLMSGWRGWDYWLDETDADNFFAGQSVAAELVAQQLLQYATATDPKNLTCLFSEAL
jgi:hypothetical protein